MYSNNIIIIHDLVKQHILVTLTTQSATKLFISKLNKFGRTWMNLKQDLHLHEVNGFVRIFLCVISRQIGYSQS